MNNLLKGKIGTWRAERKLGNVSFMESILQAVSVRDQIPEKVFQVRNAWKSDKVERFAKKIETFTKKYKNTKHKGILKKPKSPKKGRK